MLKTLEKNDIPKKFKKISRILEQILEKFRNFDENSRKKIRAFLKSLYLGLLCAVLNTAA